MTFTESKFSEYYVQNREQVPWILWLERRASTPNIMTLTESKFLEYYDWDREQVPLVQILRGTPFMPCAVKSSFKPVYRSLSRDNHMDRLPSLFWQKLVFNLQIWDHFFLNLNSGHYDSEREQVSWILWLGQRASSLNIMTRTESKFPLQVSGTPTCSSQLVVFLLLIGLMGLWLIGRTRLHGEIKKRRPRRMVPVHMSNDDISPWSLPLQIHFWL
jgi:hypothetical protein